MGLRFKDWETRSKVTYLNWQGLSRIWKPKASKNQSSAKISTLFFLIVGWIKLNSDSFNWTLSWKWIAVQRSCKRLSAGFSIEEIALAFGQISVYPTYVARCRLPSVPITRDFAIFPTKLIQLWDPLGINTSTNPTAPVSFGCQLRSAATIWKAIGWDLMRCFQNLMKSIW